MQALSAWNHRSGFCLIVLGWLAATDSVEAQGTCQCRSTRPFADCVTRVFGLDPTTGADSSYPDQFPGSGTVVRRDGIGIDGDLLYVADLFSGRAYAFWYDTSLLEDVKIFTDADGNPVVIPSPDGSQATTGLTFLNDFLLWAVTNARVTDDVAYEIWRTDVLGNDATLLGRVDMAQLAALVLEDTGDSTIVDGRLGGIDYHASTGTLWGVDIVNDLYFEFETSGELVLDGDGKPNYFFNPMRNTRVGGAYGNDLAYVANADGEFFDIPVGALADGRPSRVTRVRATAGEGFEVGDETGVFYNLDENLESPGFVTGVISWQDSCVDGQSSEFILSIDLSGGTPRVLEISADDPTSGNAAGFSCVADDADLSAARLSWHRGFMYDSLRITRRDIADPPASATVVFETSFADDPEEFTDSGLLTGTYEYVLTAEGVTGGPDVPQVCRVNIGRGRVVNLAAFGSASALPYAATIIPGDNLVVVDLESGEAATFDLALNPTGSISSPDSRGLTTGVTFSATDGLLYWLQSDGRSYFLTGVTLDGEGQTDPMRVDVPFNFERGMQLGDVAYDAANKWFWTVDLLNDVIFPVQADGLIPAAFQSEQISLGDVNRTLAGGIAVVAADVGSVTLDLLVDQAASQGTGDYVRLEINLTTGEQAEVFRFDLRSALDTGDVGGVAVAGPVGYVVGMDSATIFALQVESEGLAFFRRGDINDDGAINLSDPSSLLGALFLGDAQPTCEAAGDTNGDGTVEIGDAVFLFNYLFAGGDSPPAPFPTCGVDANTELGCGTSSCVPE